MVILMFVQEWLATFYGMVGRSFVTVAGLLTKRLRENSGHGPYNTDIPTVSNQHLVVIYLWFTIVNSFIYNYTSN